MFRQLCNLAPRISRRVSLSKGSVGTSRSIGSLSYSYDSSNQWKYSQQSAGLSVGGLFCTLLLLGSTLTSTSSCSSEKTETSAHIALKDRVFRRSDVATHTSKEAGGIWVTYENGVYDVTEFISNHPGGKDRLMLAAGKDLSEFWAQPQFQLHYKSPLAFELLEELRVGTLHEDDVVKVDKSKLGKKELQYTNKRIYDCIVIGAGISGLQCAKSLTAKHGMSTEDVLVLEAQDYIGGRVRQMSDFVKGVNIDVGPEFLHGSNTFLTKFAEENNEPISEIYCWAHGDGGPLQHTVEKGYGLYFIGDKNSHRKRLLRYDASDADFVAMNETLWDMAELNPDDYSDFHSLQDYLVSKGFSAEMLSMAEAGFANTLCTNSKDLSLKQCIKWLKLWHAEEGEDGDFSFRNSFKCLVDHLKKDIQVELSSPVSKIYYPKEGSDAEGGPTADLVRLVTEAGVTYYAKKLVITSSPYVMRSDKMSFHPPLSADLHDALDSINMHSIVKVFMKFSRPAWPKDLHGMIMADDDFLLPEIWFRVVADRVDPGEPATAYAIGFTTADYEKRVSKMNKADVMKQAVSQLDLIMSRLEHQHMAGDPNEPGTEKPSDIPKPSDVFLGGMFWDWNPKHHPYIGGGYCSPKAGKAAHMIELLSKPYGKHIFFAGEATNMPGATAHAALESGFRAADYVVDSLKKEAH